MAHGKYESLGDHLRRCGTRVRLSFSEIDQLVGALPISASTHRAWWANERGRGHVQARAWLDSGFRVAHVELGHWVEFEPDSAGALRAAESRTS